MREKQEWKPDFVRMITKRLEQRPVLRMALIGLVGLWIIAGTRYVTEMIIYRERNLKEAFAIVSPGNTTGTVALTARLPESYLTEKDQNQLIRFVADRIGLTVDTEPEPITEGKKSGFIYRKKAKYADTAIKILHVREASGANRYYLLVSINLAEDKGDGVAYFREKIGELAAELELLEVQCSIQLSGSFPQDMTLAARNHLTDRILSKLGCEVVCENREAELYTVYAYTKGLDEYIVSGNDRINVQLAMYYDEINKETVLCVASPVITGEIMGTR